MLSLLENIRSLFKHCGTSENREIEALQRQQRDNRDRFMAIRRQGEIEVEEIVNGHEKLTCKMEFSHYQNMAKQKSELEDEFNAQIDALNAEIQLEREEMINETTALRNANDAIVDKMRLEHAREISELKKSHAEAIRVKDKELEQLHISMLKLQEDCRIQLDKHRESEVISSLTSAVCCPTEDLKHLDIKTVEGEKGSEVISSLNSAVCCPNEDLKRLDIKTVEGEKEVEVKTTREPDRPEDADRTGGSEEFIRYPSDRLEKKDTMTTIVWTPPVRISLRDPQRIRITEIHDD